MSRQRINLNREWKFTRGDIAGAADVSFDDSAWHPIHLPHCFDIPYFRTPDFYVGVGWYRKRYHYTGPRDPKGNFFAIEFGAVFQSAEIYINGQLAGHHQGGYSAFLIPINVPLDREILIAIRVSNEWNPQLAPRAGEHIFSGGIYRDVHLIIDSPVHLDWRGPKISTPQVSAASAVVNIKTTVHNQSPLRSRCNLRHTITDPHGQAITTIASEHSIPAGESFEFVQTSQPIAHPNLWHPDHPHLYTVTTALFVHDGPETELKSTFGIRWFEWTADRGFFLNGQHLYLRGANAHQDIAGWGIAATATSCARDVQIMKDAGFNFIRGAHYPHHQAFADACDRIGLLFWSENCFWGKGGFAGEGYWNASAYPVNADDFAPFESSCKSALREMITENFNHPSIIAWSMTNEAFFTFNVDRTRDLIKSLVDLSHELDPTRPAAIGGAQRGGFDQLGDVAGYNGDGARLFINPGVPNMVSEYGAVSKGQPGEYSPYFGEMQPDEFPWRSGQAIWCAFDYGTIAGKQGLKGIVDHYRLPKRSWYWYRNEYLGIAPPAWPTNSPSVALQLSADKLIIADTNGTDDVLLTVTVHDVNGNRVTHSPPITLTLESGPGEFPTGRSITFDAGTDIRIVDGQAAITLRSYHAGQSLIRATSLNLKDATITITTLGEPQFVSGKTALCEPRPYTPPLPSSAAIAAANSIANVAKDRPSRASDELPDHPARLANDGDFNSFWSAPLGQLSPWWLVDMEGFYQLSSSKITFAASGDFNYSVELSNDAHHWDKVIDRRQTEKAGPTRHDVYPPGAAARYVRITCSDLPNNQSAKLHEVEIFGVLSNR